MVEASLSVELHKLRLKLSAKLSLNYAYLTVSGAVAGAHGSSRSSGNFKVYFQQFAIALAFKCGINCKHVPTTILFGVDVGIISSNLGDFEPS